MSGIKLFLSYEGGDLNYVKRVKSLLDAASATSFGHL